MNIDINEIRLMIKELIEDAVDCGSDYVEGSIIYNEIDKDYSARGMFDCIEYEGDKVVVNFKYEDGIIEIFPSL